MWRRDIDELVYQRGAESMLCIAWSPSGSHIASGGADKTIRVSDTSTGSTTAICQAPNVVCATC